MPNLMQRIRSLWSKDDRSIGGAYIAGGVADYERDSEPPRY